jgi:hypothetical protein
MLKVVGGALFVPLLLLLVLVLLLGREVAAQPSWSSFSNLRTEGLLAATPKTTRVLTNNATLNALGSYQPISSTAAVGTSGANITVKAAGSLLVLVNVGAATITFTETGTLISAGNIVLGAGDSATLISNGVNWYQIAASNN